MPIVKQRLPLTHPALSIICTTGPSVFDAKIESGELMVTKSLFKKLLSKGMGIVRINFSHVLPEDYDRIRGLIKHVRQIEEEEKIPIPIIMDLRGPEIRIVEIQMRDKNEDVHSQFIQQNEFKIGRSESIKLCKAEDRNSPLPANISCRIILSFEGDFYSSVNNKDTVVIGDNDIYLKVEKKFAHGIICSAENRGTIKVRQSLNLPDARELKIESVIIEDDIKALNADFDIDIIAQSFIQKAGDVQNLIGCLAGTSLKNKPIIAKIETPAAVADIKNILDIDQVFGIMVARGDLGVLAEYSRIPQIQQDLINEANKLGRPVIVATQMLESMINRPKPWRPEVQDICTAIKGGADTLMLSGETAVGQFPEESVEVMKEVTRVNTPVDQREYLKKFKEDFSIPEPKRPIDVLGYAICEIAKEASSPYIFSYATTGTSATMISRFRPQVPVIAITKSQETARILILLYNVYPVLVDRPNLPREPKEFIKFIKELIDELGIKESISQNAEIQKRLFLVATQELTQIVAPENGVLGPRARGIFVFEP
jgi:pyruvate kinase